MKTLITMQAKLVLLFAFAAAVLNTALAQNTKKDKSAKKEAEVKSMVDSKSYVFKAEYVLPLRGEQRYLTSDYDLRIGTDSLVSYLPYFGRAYVAPVNPEDNSMIFTTTRFDYKIKPNRYGWEIVFNPKDTKDVRVINLMITKDGYATLNVISQNRDAISYQGYIQSKKQKV